MMAILALSGCSSQLTVIEGEQMTMPYRIVIGCSLSSREVTALHKELTSVFTLIDTVYNNWNPSSELSKINRAPAQQPLPISTDLLDFLKQVEQFHLISEGKFDPTLGNLKSLWLLHLKNHTLPSESTWQELHRHSGWRQISIDVSQKTLTKATPDVHIDLCGAVKGFAVDKLSQVCTKFCTNHYVEWGGEIKVSGQHPSKRPWRIASSSTPEILELHDIAVATSGTHYQKWSVNGHVYTHILNPETGYPLEAHRDPISSVTILHPSCAFADAMATALMTFPSKEEALAWAKEKHIQAYINDNAS